jgi:MFS family permease
MVGAALVALMANTGVIQGFSLSVFIVPITKDLGISRGDLLGAPIFGSVFFVLLVMPLFGKAIDRYGLRRVHMAMIVGFAIGTMCLAFLRTPFYIMVLLFGFQQLFGAGQSPIAYTKAIAAWFDKDRGLALGIAIAGVGLGVAVIPAMDSYLIVHYGWRAAFVGMGVSILVLALIPVFLFEREPPHPPERLRAKNDTSIPGFLWRDAVLKDWRFGAMTVTFFLAPVAINGTVTQIVPMLLDRHIPLAVAVGALSASGVALTVGRILSGYCLDKIHGPYVAAVFFAASGIGIALLAGGYALYLGVILCGAGIGGEVDLMAFLVSRYFGLRCFGAIYATMFALFSLGVALGPFLLGVSHDKFGSYVPMMMVNIGFIVVMCALLLALGPYRFAVREAPRAPALADAPAE